jgi:t-SNARE complex subunit (syntaxin)
VFSIIAGVTAFLWLGLWRAKKETSSWIITAQLLARRLELPILRAGLVPAVELALEMEVGGECFSAPLAQAHIEQMAKALSLFSVQKVFPSQPVQQAAKWAGITILLGVITSVLCWGAVTEGWQRLLTRHSPEKSVLLHLQEPITGEIELTYTYPAYTGLPTRTLPVTAGEISAPKGTRVHLKTRADRQIGGALLVVGELKTPLKVSKGRDLSGTILVSDSGYYRFRFSDAQGKQLVEGPPIPIAVEEDVRPKVSIISPSSPLEVDPKSILTIRYEAQDDYGLSELALLYRLPGAVNPQKIVLQQDPQTPPSSSGEYFWDLSTLNLLAGDSIAYYVEAVDNDPVSGKKAGASSTHLLKIYSEAEHHRQAIKRIEKSWDDLIHLLADRLEASNHFNDFADNFDRQLSTSQFETDERGINIAQNFQDLCSELRKVKTPEHLWRAMQNVSHSIRQKVSQTMKMRSSLKESTQKRIKGFYYKELRDGLFEEIAEEEKDVLYLETLLNEQRITDLKSLFRELSSKRRTLSETLENYRTAPNEETRERLLNEISRLKDRITELMQRMAELSEGIKDEHINAEALKELGESQGVVNSLEKMQNMLRIGQVEEAMKEMEKFGQMFDELENNLNKASNDFQNTEMSKLARSLEEFALQLRGLEAEEKKVLNQTQHVRKRYKSKLKEQLAKKGTDFFEKMHQKVDEARKNLQAITRGSGLWRDNELQNAQEEVETLDNALKVGDFDQAAQSVAKALSHTHGLVEEWEQQVRDSRWLRSSEWGKEIAEDEKNARHSGAAFLSLQLVSQEITGLFPTAENALDTADKQQLDHLSKKQSELKEQAYRLTEKMSEMNQEAPLFSTEAKEKLQAVAKRMGQAQGQLRMHRPTTALAEQRAALDELANLLKGLEKSTGKGKSGGRSIPWPWIGQGSEIADQGVGRDDSALHEKVHIPGADQFRVPEEYRKEILDAMKQKTPEAYQEPVRRYYEEIVK